MFPADVIFVTEDKKHPVYKREGLDLLTEKTISLQEALVGFTLPLVTLDNRTLKVAITQVVRYTITILFKVICLQLTKYISGRE